MKEATRAVVEVLGQVERYRELCATGDQVLASLPSIIDRIEVTEAWSSGHGVAATPLDALCGLDSVLLATLHQRLQRQLENMRFVTERMEELCDLIRREVHALHARMDHERVEAAALSTRSKRRPFSSADAIAWAEDLSTMFSTEYPGLSLAARPLYPMPRAGSLHSLPLPPRTALRRRRVMQQLLDTAKMDQEGAASLAVDWAADADCVDPVLVDSVASKVAHFRHKASPARRGERGTPA